VKIIKVKKLSHLKFDKYINSTAEKEKDAVEWAEKRGADTLYWFEPGKLWIIRADIEKEENETI